MAQSATIGEPGGRARHFVRIWALLLAFSLFMACAGCARRAADSIPRAVDGVLDLRGIDLAQTGPLALNGEWQFYWDRLLSPGDFAADAVPQPADVFVLPGTWRGRRHAGERLGGTGQATLRLRLFVDPGAEPLGVRLIDVQQAYRLWADGRLVAQSGVVGRSAGEETPQRSLRLAKIPRRNGSVDLVLQVSNHHFRTGGVPEPILVAPPGVLERQRTQRWALALFFTGSILIIGLYHLALYLVRRRDVAPLYFGLYCLLTIGYTVNSNTSQWVMTLFAPKLDPAFMENFALLCFMAWPSLRFRFFQALYSGEFHKIIYRIGDARTAVFLGFLLFAPGVPLYWYVLFCLMLSLFLGLYNIQRLAVCVRRGRAGALLMLAGCGIHMVTGINDVFLHAGWIESVYVVESGMFLFVLCQTVALAQYFAGAFHTVSRLSCELENKNLRLQQEMTERDQLAREVVNISEEERRRISRELHDGLCQKLTGARLRASALAQRLAKTERGGEMALLAQLLDASADDAYNTSRGLWPVEHDPATPGPSLSDLARSVSQNTGMAVKFEKHLWCAQCVNPHANAIYRIAQEALANAVKHSRARNICMTLCCEEPDSLALRVRDDGIGREAAGKSGHTRGGGLGLNIMAHRARIIGAELSIEDVPDGGTVVACVAPCPAAPSNGKQTKEPSRDKE